MNPTTLPFTKMHGLGNDFLVVDAAQAGGLPWATLAPLLCDRRRGVGADGVLLVGPGGEGRLRMRLANADGSDAEMCGNGVRCAAVWAAARGLAGDRVNWETEAGPVATELLGDGLVRVDMGAPRFAPDDVPVRAATGDALDLVVDVAGELSVHAMAVGMGNPHCVVPLDDVEAGVPRPGATGQSLPVPVAGEAIQRAGLFPAGVNVEFVQVLSPLRIRQRTVERGVGETDACGTGACAAVAALRRTGLIAPDGEVVVELRGGVLRIDWPGAGPMLMTGPAVTVFEGRVALPAATAAAS
jgi:diaminopimelate epimerase